MLGPVQVVPPQGLTALRGLHLDRTCAPAVTWQLAEAGHEQDHLKSECPRFQGNPVPAERNQSAPICALGATRRDDAITDQIGGSARGYLADLWHHYRSHDHERPPQMKSRACIFIQTPLNRQHSVMPRLAGSMAGGQFQLALACVPAERKPSRAMTTARLIPAVTTGVSAASHPDGSNRRRTSRSAACPPRTDGHLPRCTPRLREALCNSAGSSRLCSQSSSWRTS